MNLHKKREDIANLLEVLYLILFAVITAYLVLGRTAFPIPWDAMMKTEEEKMRMWSRLFIVSPYYLLSVTVVLRYLIQKKYDWKMTVIGGMVLHIGRYMWQEGGHSAVLLLTLLVVGAYKIPWKKMIKLYFMITTGILLLAIICSLLGWIDNYTYVLERGTRRSFGIHSPPQFGAFVFFQILCWWYLRKEKLTYLEAVITFGIALFLKIFSDARTAYLSLFGVASVMVWQRYRHQQLQQKGEEYQMNKGWSMLLALAHPLAAMVIAGLTLLYSAQSDIMMKLDHWLSSRLSLGKKGFDVYGIRLFGSYVPSYTHAEEQTGIYYFIDSSYIQLIIIYGIAILAIVLLAFLFISSRARVQRDSVFLWILAFAAVHGMIVPCLMDLQFCPFMLAVFADTSDGKGMEIREIFGSRKWIRKQ